MRILILALLPTLLGGCVVASIASTAVDIAKIPVKVASAGVDAATTSQSEADEKRGRALRKADEQRARDERKRCKSFTERREPCPPPPLES
jgi:hypothetical protein